MDRKGPRQGFTTRFMAQTAYKAGWKFDWQKRAGACRIANASAVLTITYTYPEVSSPMSADLRHRWNRFIAGVRRHEETHGRIAREMVAAAERQLMGSLTAMILAAGRRGPKSNGGSPQSTPPTRRARPSSTASSMPRAETSKDWCRCSAGRADRLIQAGSKGIASIPASCRCLCSKASRSAIECASSRRWRPSCRHSAWRSQCLRCPVQCREWCLRKQIPSTPDKNGDHPYLPRLHRKGLLQWAGVQLLT